MTGVLTIWKLVIWRKFHSFFVTRYFFPFQDLLQELDDSHHRLESLHGSVDEKLNETPQKEFQEMKSEVTQLEDRWMRFKRKLVELAEDNQRVVKRQTEFDQEHVKICSVLETVLRGTENTSLDQTDMAVDLERVEVSVIPQEG